MLWLLYYSFIGIVGTIEENLICYHQTILACESLNKVISKEICGKGDESCVSRAAELCDMKNDEDIRSAMSFWKELCQDGSDIHKKYKKYNECIPTPTEYLGWSELEKPVSSGDYSVIDISNEAMKISCRNIEKLHSCLEENVEKKCGSDARSFFTQMLNAEGKQISQLVCEEVNGSRENSAHLFMWFLQIAILVITFKGFFF